MAFTPEELEEMRRADAEIEAEFAWTNEELALSRELDRVAAVEAMSPEKRKVAEYQRVLADTRLALGYTQRELAKIVGCSQPAISRLESGSLRLDGFADREKLLAVLGVEM